MANSLLDQLQKSGLVDAKKAGQVKKDKRKQEKSQRKGKPAPTDETKVALEQAKAQKIARDKQLNHEKDERAGRKALAAQIKQLIENHGIAASGDQAFNFSDGKRVKRIYVDSPQAGRLSRGVFCIVKLGDKYHIVPTTVADRIAERDAQRIVFKAKKEDIEIDPDDPYADYKIPDDLMW